MKLWTLVLLLGLAAAVCAGLALLVALRTGLDPYLVANAAMFALMAVYVARLASRRKQPLGTPCRRCGGPEPDPGMGFCLRCGHIPRAFRTTGYRPG